MTEHQAIEQELQDLSGLLADLYRRVAVAEPARGAQVGLVLGQAALAFTGLSGGSARGAHI